MFELHSKDKSDSPWIDHHFAFNIFFIYATRIQSTYFKRPFRNDTKQVDWVGFYYDNSLKRYGFQFQAVSCSRKTSVLTLSICTEIANFLYWNLLESFFFWGKILWSEKDMTRCCQWQHSPLFVCFLRFAQRIDNNLRNFALFRLWRQGKLIVS